MNKKQQDRSFIKIWLSAIDLVNKDLLKSCIDFTKIPNVSSEPEESDDAKLNRLLQNAKTRIENNWEIQSFFNPIILALKDGETIFSETNNMITGIGRGENNASYRDIFWRLISSSVYYITRQHYAINEFILKQIQIHQKNGVDLNKIAEKFANDIKDTEPIKTCSTIEDLPERIKKYFDINKRWFPGTLYYQLWNYNDKANIDDFVGTMTNVVLYCIKDDDTVKKYSEVAKFWGSLTDKLIQPIKPTDILIDISDDTWEKAKKILNKINECIQSKYDSLCDIGKIVNKPTTTRETIEPFIQIADAVEYLIKGTDNENLLHQFANKLRFYTNLYETKKTKSYYSISAATNDNSDIIEYLERMKHIICGFVRVVTTPESNILFILKTLIEVTIATVPSLKNPNTDKTERISNAVGKGINNVVNEISDTELVFKPETTEQEKENIKSKIQSIINKLTYNKENIQYILSFISTELYYRTLIKSATGLATDEVWAIVRDFVYELFNKDTREGQSFIDKILHEPFYDNSFVGYVVGYVGTALNIPKNVVSFSANKFSGLGSSARNIGSNLYDIGTAAYRFGGKAASAVGSGAYTVGSAVGSGAYTFGSIAADKIFSFTYNNIKPFIFGIILILGIAATLVLGFMGKRSSANPIIAPITYVTEYVSDKTQKEINKLATINPLSDPTPPTPVYTKEMVDKNVAEAKALDDTYSTLYDNQNVDYRKSYYKSQSLNNMQDWTPYFIKLYGTFLVVYAIVLLFQSNKSIVQKIISFFFVAFVTNIYVLKAFVSILIVLYMFLRSYIPQLFMY
jgi:hypothetical protein